MKFSSSEGISDQKDIEGLRRMVQIMATQLETLLNGQVNFQDNLRCQILSVTFPTANLNQPVAISLNAMPIGYLVIGKDSSFDVYNGSTSVLNKSFITLRASAPGTATIMVF